MTITATYFRNNSPRGRTGGSLGKVVHPAFFVFLGLKLIGNDR